MILTESRRGGERAPRAAAFESDHRAPDVQMNGSQARAMDAVIPGYNAARERAALFDRSMRGIIVVSGKDRKAWLHNLVTNAVKTLEPGQGNYAFACDVRGRIQFDLNLLVRDEAIWIDIDRDAIQRALEHLERFHITEDVQLRNATDDWCRIGIAGPQSAVLAAGIGVANLVALPELSPVAAELGSVLFKHAFAGGIGFELLIPPSAAADLRDRLIAAGAVAALPEALDIHRIEAGIPWLGRDIDEKTLPAETGQVERAVSYHKGCYLGQEVIERMRAYGSLARVLKRFETADGANLALPSPIFAEGKEAGRLTSLVRHPTRGVWLGLGYLRTSVEAAARLTIGEPPRPIVVRV